MRAPISQNGRLAWIDRRGNPLGSPGTRRATHRRLPDEKRLAASLATQAPTPSKSVTDPRAAAPPVARRDRTAALGPMARGDPEHRRKIELTKERCRRRKQSTRAREARARTTVTDDPDGRHASPAARRQRRAPRREKRGRAKHARAEESTATTDGAGRHENSGKEDARPPRRPERQPTRGGTSRGRAEDATHRRRKPGGRRGRTAKHCRRSGVDSQPRGRRRERERKRERGGKEKEDTKF